MLWGLLFIACVLITPLLIKYRWARGVVLIGVPIFMMVTLAMMKALVLVMRIPLAILAPTVGRNMDGSLPPQRRY